MEGAAMASAGFDDEWDADFVDQLVQAEEHALAISTQKSFPPPQPPPPQQLLYSAASYDVGGSFSPPRDLSQRVVPQVPRGFNHSLDFSAFSGNAGSALPVSGAHNARDQEIDKLKRELERISEQRNRLVLHIPYPQGPHEQECIELRNGRDKKKKGLKFDSQKIVNINTDLGINIQGDHIKSLELQNARSMNDHIGSSTKVGTISSKDVGIQTERHDESISLSSESKLSDTFCRRNKLLDAWSSSSGQRLGRLLISKLYSTCEVDFRVLSGYLNMSFPLRTSTESNISFKDNLQYTHSDESAKVSHLFSVLTKINDEMVRFEDLLEALVGLCRLKNVSIIHRSLHILQEVLSFTFNMEGKFGNRDNIVVDGKPTCWNNASELYEYGYPGNKGLPHVHAEKIFDQAADGLRLDTGFINCGSSCLISSSFNYIPLFELMCEIVMIHDVEHVRLEAVSVMNLIVARSNAYLERDKYGTDRLFQSTVKLLKKGARLHVKRKAVHLLHMLLNLMASFCSCLMEGDGSGMVDTNSNKSSTFSVISAIFESLAECITCTGSNTEELQLRRHTIILLAFFASSGKCGVEILLNYGLPKGKDFPAIILQSLVCDLDLEESDTAQQPEVFKERTLLVREVLILLNRLVSHPKYSSHALRALTNSREKATLTVDVTSRLSSKHTFFWQDVSMTRQIRESEIIDLAQVLTRRVFTFLGGSSQ
ncbi:protein SENSITIVE TO UV 2 isoform X3 [Capsicum annuum]|uniref:protein SENSITIVE TO UV 2 isoform X3 n=1 Tax=Capsicum annuum TaxID=4072 RepID=UPI001FB17490|nr:protein SENSITIVE TO UV 2 isoform X3 [Capsicum annuum]